MDEDPMDYDTFLDKTATIRKWIAGSTVGTSDLLTELAYWVDFFDGDGSIDHPYPDGKY